MPESQPQLDAPEKVASISSPPTEENQQAEPVTVQEVDDQRWQRHASVAIQGYIREQGS